MNISAVENEANKLRERIVQHEHALRYHESALHKCRMALDAINRSLREAREKDLAKP